MDPKTISDVINALSVYKTGVEEQLGVVTSVGSVLGIGKDPNEVIKQGSYKYYTRGERSLYKTYSLG
jgi:hypothetical protein